MKVTSKHFREHTSKSVFSRKFRKILQEVKRFSWKDQVTLEMNLASQFLKKFERVLRKCVILSHESHELREILRKFGKLPKMRKKLPRNSGKKLRRIQFPDALRSFMGILETSHEVDGTSHEVQARHFSKSSWNFSGSTGNFLQSSRMSPRCSINF